MEGRSSPGAAGGKGCRIDRLCLGDRTMDLDLIKRILMALEREEVRYVVFGAVAINLLGLARATEDLDLFIAPEPENIERLKRALHSVFADPSKED